MKENSIDLVKTRILLRLPPNKQRIPFKATKVNKSCRYWGKRISVFWERLGCLQRTSGVITGNSFQKKRHYWGRRDTVHNIFSYCAHIVDTFQLTIDIDVHHFCYWAYPILFHLVHWNCVHDLKWYLVQVTDETI